MKWFVSQDTVNSIFLRAIEKTSGENISQCYQCGKCSAGCPIAFQMDLPPNQIMRMIQLGMEEQVLRSKTIWLCASCETCTTRCPREVDLAAVMDSARILAVHKGVKSRVRTVRLFNKLFLGIIRKYGRIFEMELIAKFKFTSFKFFQDIFKAPVLFIKGRLKILPSISDRKGIKKIFKEIKTRRKAEEKAKPTRTS